MVSNNRKDKAHIEEEILEVVKEISSLNNDEIYTELLEELQSGAEEVYDEMVDAGFDLGTLEVSEVHDGDVSDYDISVRREEKVDAIIDNFFDNLQALESDLSDDKKDKIREKILHASEEE